MKTLLVVLLFSAISLAEGGKVISLEESNRDFARGFRRQHSMSVTIRLGDTDYTAKCHESTARSLVVNDPVEAALDGDHIIISPVGHKPERAKITARAHWEKGDK